MSAPAVVIRIELERTPVVYFDCLHEGDELRLRDWIARHLDYEELVERARALGEAA